jgi:hypothetical protein
MNQLSQRFGGFMANEEYDEENFKVGTYCSVKVPDGSIPVTGYILNRKISSWRRLDGKNAYSWLVAHKYGIMWLGEGVMGPPLEVIDKSSLNLPMPLEVDYRDLLPEDTKPLYGDYKYSWDYVGFDYRK